MNYPSIRIEGAILSPDILDRLEELPGQKPSDFGFDGSIKVKDEIARAWADAQDYWRIFQRKLEAVRPDSPATTETRQQWVTPLLGLLGYQVEYQHKGLVLNEKIYNISHLASNRSHAPVQIVGYRDPAGLDRKPERAALRMSAHAIVQEFLNLNDQLYGLVTNGRVLRLLRDSSRLIRLSYLEFDLDRIFTDGLFADFAILYRLLHATRLPRTNETAAESFIERYHQDSLDSGARIRDGLSRAVELALRDFGSGFLAHPENEALRAAIASGEVTPEIYYKDLLRLIYRLLFLMVIEERHLVFPPEASPAQREIYRRYYSLQRLRTLSEKRYLADKRRHDLWLALAATFRLFEAEGPGLKLGLAPLAGDLFRHDAIGPLAECRLGNDVLLGCLRSLSLYEHPDSGQIIRVNYGSLNVEEFGSVYEGLLEYEPIFLNDGAHTEFGFKQGDERSATGSHYTPDELVQPLIKHSLDYQISDRLKAPDPEAALLDLRVADIACGSGHILLAAARHIAIALAVVRTGEEQPSPLAYRTALRDVIRTCIYGVDLNPLAVELCKVALWLEAHSPGQPLNFMDHHIKCGNSIVGFVRREELDKGVPEEAFVTMPHDDKEVAGPWRRRNKEERKDVAGTPLDYSPELRHSLDEVLAQWKALAALPERTSAEIEAKKAAFTALANAKDALVLHQMAAIPIAQFYIPKTEDNEGKLITDAEFRRYWAGAESPGGRAAAMAWEIAQRKRFFHWFLEFPEIVARGGFDCILGNPPYLGGTYLSGRFGYPFCHYLKWEFAPAGLSDLVAYFVRRIYCILKDKGYSAFVTTNSIKDGDIREDGLSYILKNGAAITMAISGRKWPGKANLVVSVVSLKKGVFSGKPILDGRMVDYISPFLDDQDDIGDPHPIVENMKAIMVGSEWGGEYFLIDPTLAQTIIKEDKACGEVVLPLINGEEINSHPLQQSDRFAIYFKNYTIDEAKNFTSAYELLEASLASHIKSNPDYTPRPEWWRFRRPTIEMYHRIVNLNRCFVVARTTKYFCLSALPTNIVISEASKVFTTDRWDLFAIVQSNLHEVWARKYSGALETRLRYSPTDCFENFPFPEGLWQTPIATLVTLGERYHEYRRTLMRQLWLGLTDIYNLFHARDLTPAKVAQVSKKSTEEAEVGYQGILELRRLHRELDLAVRDAYGWADLDLDHDFVEVETLPENDRVRYTISPVARKEVLKRLLAENHARAKKEAQAAAVKPPKAKAGKKAAAKDGGATALFKDAE